MRNLKNSRIAVGLVQLAKMISHGCMAQQLIHPIVMLAGSLDEETPELASLSIQHAELERDAHKSHDRFDSVILMRFRNFLRRSLQRVKRTAIVLARLVNGAHDSLITKDQLVDIHF